MFPQSLPVLRAAQPWCNEKERFPYIGKWHACLLCMQSLPFYPGRSSNVIRATGSTLFGRQTRNNTSQLSMLKDKLNLNIRRALVYVMRLVVHWCIGLENLLCYKSLCQHNIVSQSRILLRIGSWLFKIWCVDVIFGGCELFTERVISGLSCRSTSWVSTSLLMNVC